MPNSHYIVDKKFQHGFSLIELAILMSLLATISIGYLTWNTNPAISDGEKLAQTKQKIAAIHIAISKFVRDYGRLPCPANRTTPFYTISGNINFDDEYVSYTGNGKECLGQNATTHQPVGSVPTKALKLPADYMLDAWGRRLIYHVSSNLCGNASSPAYSQNCTQVSYTQTVNQPNLTILANSGGTTVASNVAYVLLSLGSDGYGAYLPSGTQKTTPPAANTDETENTNDDTNYVQHGISSGFTNIVTYKTLSQINDYYSLPLAPLIPIGFCAANSATIAALGVSGGSYIALSNIRSNTTLNQLVQRCVGSSTYPCPNTTSNPAYNNADEVVLNLFWIIQEACWEYYGSGYSRSCTTPGFNYSTSNSCCPGGGTFDSVTNSCYCGKGTWNGSC